MFNQCRKNYVVWGGGILYETGVVLEIGLVVSLMCMLIIALDSSEWEPVESKIRYETSPSHLLLICNSCETGDTSVVVLFVLCLGV